MVFSGPPQNFKRVPINQQLTQQGQTLMLQKGLCLSNLIVHASYLINLASPKKQVVQNSIRHLVLEIDRANQLGATYLVLHPGSCLQADRKNALAQLSFYLDYVLNQTQKVIVCLETMSGKGNEVGVNFVEIATIIKNIKQQERIGVCFDTCHLHESGYDIGNLAQLVTIFKQYLPLSFLKVIHLNDSKNQIGAKKDRHANIGYGQIGFNILNKWAYYLAFKHIPKILETPYFANKPVYKQEIIALKKQKFIDFKNAHTH